MPEIPVSPIAVVPYGHPDLFSVYINETEYEEVSYIKITRKINQVDGFELKIMDVTSADTNVRYKKIVKIFAESKLILKGRIEEVKYQTDGFASVKGYGISVILADKDYIARTTWSASTRTIINTLLSFNNDAASPFILTPGTIEDFGSDVDFRAEYDNKLKTIDAFARQLDWDWWISHKDLPYNDNIFNFAPWRGSLAPVYQIELSGTGQNGIITERNDNFNKLINSVSYLGKGEGTSQIKTKISLASTAYDRLDQTFTAPSDMSTSTPIVLITGKGFPNYGVINIGRMAAAYWGKTANILGLTTPAGYVWYDTEVGTGSGTAQNMSHYKGTLCTLLFNGAHAVSESRYMTLNGPIDDVADSIYLSVPPAGVLPSPGYIIVGNEMIYYEDWDTPTYSVNGCLRGQLGTIASEHDDGMFVFWAEPEYLYTTSNPQTGSSIEVNELKQVVLTDPTKESERQLEMETTNFLLRNATITYEISFEVVDYLEFLDKVNIGDRIIIIDSDTGLNDNFRVLGFDLNWNYGDVRLIVDASNKKSTETTFIEDVGGINRLLQTRLRYGQV